MANITSKEELLNIAKTAIHRESIVHAIENFEMVSSDEYMHLMAVCQELLEETIKYNEQLSITMNKLVELQKQLD